MAKLRLAALVTLGLYLFDPVSASADAPNADLAESLLRLKARRLGVPAQWNFEKYLVAPNGQFVSRYAPGVAPENAGLVGEIERLLEAPRPDAPGTGLAQ